ncbi:hypothetical protein Cpir12675_006935 [Ceratocystis pirilliformis]|uniref:Uncharacterized protein n=1 Tax=Ceratocystis pirilliformis TaxID=259994 RepID=A0ABR3YDE3_9PEZI
MASITAVRPSHHNPRASDDFDTASIRSYVSEAPSYHTIPPNEKVPEYTARDVPPYTRTEPPRYGLPPIPTHRPVPLPSLAAFSIPTWSTVHSNPTSRNYQNIARRRMTAGSSSSINTTASTNSTAASTSTRTLDQEQPRAREPDAVTASSSSRPLEDPYLVGETAAAQARAQRLAREAQEDILVIEDRRWDWFLAHISDLESRERSWSRFRRNIENQQRGKRRRLARLGSFL